MQAAKLAGPATLTASGALLFVALFFGDGVSDSRLFWLGAFALLTVAVAIAAGPVPVPGRAGAALLVLLSATLLIGESRWRPVTRPTRR